MSPKKKEFTGIWSLLKTIKDFWPLLMVLVGIIGTIITIPTRLQAQEKKVEVLEQKAGTIEKWIDGQEKIQELMKKAPPGFIWDIKTETFVPDPAAKKGK